MLSPSLSLYYINIRPDRAMWQTSVKIEPITDPKSVKLSIKK